MEQEEMNYRVKAFKIVLLLAIAGVLSVAAQVRKQEICTKVDAYSVLYRFDRTAKSTVDTNDPTEFDKRVVENVWNQLRRKVGNDFINNLYFSHGVGVDFDRKSELSFNDLKRIDGYDITFEVRVGNNGAYRYAFAVGTDRTGKFLSDIDLPNIALAPEKGVIKPCVDAVNIARSSKVLTENKNIFVKLQFDRVDNVFVWDVYAYREGLTSNHVLMNANSLAIIKTFVEHEAF